MDFDQKDLPKIIEYLKYAVSNTTIPTKINAYKAIIHEMENEYTDYVFQTWRIENEEMLNDRFEMKLSEQGRTRNNGENVEKYDEFCQDEFDKELSSDDKDFYDRVVDAVNLNTFNL